MTGQELLTTDLMPEKLCLCILSAVRAFYTIDNELLYGGIEGSGILGEWSMVFRFGCYLQSKLTKFPEYRSYFLDSEYNRHGYDFKRLPGSEKKVRPDLCLHERRNDTHNLLVIEFKKDEQNGDEDRKK